MVVVDILTLAVLSPCCLLLKYATYSERTTMRLSAIVYDHLKWVAKVSGSNAANTADKAVRIMNGPNHIDSLELTSSLVLGQVLRPFREFKFYINSKLETLSPSNLIVVYRLNCPEERCHFPDEPDGPMPRAVFLIYRDIDFKDLPCKEGLIKLLPTVNITQLMLITTQSETIGRIAVD